MSYLMNNMPLHQADELVYGGVDEGFPMSKICKL